jgi:hypothetical protein
VQDDDTDDSGLEDFQSVDNQGVNAGSYSVYLLALQQENNSQSSLDSIVKSDYKQITQAQSEV